MPRLKSMFEEPKLGPVNLVYYLLKEVLPNDFCYFAGFDYNYFPNTPPLKLKFVPPKFKDGEGFDYKKLFCSYLLFSAFGYWVKAFPKRGFFSSYFCLPVSELFPKMLGFALAYNPNALFISFFGCYVDLLNIVVPAKGLELVFLNILFEL